MALSLFTVGSKLTAAALNAIINALNLTASAMIIPTISGTGGSTAVNATTGEVTGSGAITALRINSTTTILSQFKYVELIIRYNGSTAGSHTLNEALGSAIDVTAGSYFSQGGIFSGPTGTGLGSGGTTAWTQGYTGTRQNRRTEYHLYNMTDTLGTTFISTSVDSNGGSVLLMAGNVGEHTVATAFDGWNITFTGLGTISNLSVVARGHY